MENKYQRNVRATVRILQPQMTTIRIKPARGLPAHGILEVG